MTAAHCDLDSNQGCQSSKPTTFTADLSHYQCAAQDQTIIGKIIERFQTAEYVAYPIFSI